MPRLPSGSACAVLPAPARCCHGAWSLLRMVTSRQQMGEFVLSRGMQWLGWLQFVVICGAKLLLIIGL